MVKVEELPAASGRIKREDCHKTKLDSCLSNWQVLVGPCDWEDHSLGKEGANRYRVHNLPCGSGPGVYELGIAIPPSSSRLKDRGVTVVYLGQAENIRSRLQNYGRTGAHLGSGCASKDKDCAEKGPGLFEERLKEGFSIVFRWAPAKDKKTAERMEAEMLDQFDYAWNKGSNGSRRPSDIHKKLNRNASATNGCSNTSNKLRLVNQGRVGAMIEPSNPLSLLISRGRVGAKIEPSKLLPSNLRNYLVDEGVEYFLHSVFKFSRSQPIQIERFGINVDLGYQCGYISNGVPCRLPPVPGRKRCQEHKGKRISGSKNKPIKEGDPNGKHDNGYPKCSGKKTKEKQHNPSKPNAEIKLPLVLISPDAELKRSQNPFSLQKPIFSWSKTEEKPINSSIISVYGTSGRCTNNYTSPRLDTGRKLQTSNRSSATADSFPTCGATLENGSFCRRQPVQGNKRCWQHKGRRAPSAMYYGCDSGFDMVTCGAGLRNGSVCMRAPVPGRKRCEQHKGMRAG